MNFASTTTRAEARAKGLIRYMTGKPCKHGHISERFTSNGWCVSCSESTDKEAKRDYDRARVAEKSEEIALQGRERYLRNREIYALKAKEWVSKNPEKRAAILRAYKLRAREEKPWYAMSVRVRARIRQCLINRGYKKKNTTESILGCTSSEFISHIEKQFTKGMSWDRISEIHVDHIVPLATARSEEEVLALCHFTNLRPIWAKDNLSKGASREFLI